MENVDWVYDTAKNSWHQEKLHNLKSAMRKMTMDEIENQKLGIFEGYIRSLVSKNTIA